MKNRIEEIEDAIKIVGPIAAVCGVSEQDTMLIVEYIDKLRERGISGSEGGLLLRQYLKDGKL